MNPYRASELVRHLADPAVRALVLAALAGIGLRLFSVRSHTVRLSVWTSVLYAALGMPLAAWMLPGLRIPLHPDPNSTLGSVILRIIPQNGASLPATSAHSAAAPIGALNHDSRRPHATLRTTATTVPSGANKSYRGSAAAFEAVGSDAAAKSIRPLSAATANASEMNRFSWPYSPATTILAIYALVSLLILLRAALGFLLSQRLRKRAVPIGDARAERWLDWYVLTMQPSPKPVLAESSAVNVPLALGLWRPAIVLPADWREWDDRKLAAVIAHEVSHVQRHDLRTKAFAVLYRCAFWFSPLAWWLERSLGDLAERASDEAAIRAGADPTYYAEVLMSFYELIEHARGRVAVPGVAMAHGKRALGRIEAVLSATHRVPGRLRKSMVALAVLAAVPLVILTAASRPEIVAASAPAAHAAIGQDPAAPPPPAAPDVAPVPPVEPPAPAAGEDNVVDSVPPPPPAPGDPPEPVGPVAPLGPLDLVAPLPPGQENMALVKAKLDELQAQIAEATSKLAKAQIDHNQEAAARANEELATLEARLNAHQAMAAKALYDRLGSERSAESFARIKAQIDAVHRLAYFHSSAQYAQSAARLKAELDKAQAMSSTRYFQSVGAGTYVSGKDGLNWTINGENGGDDFAIVSGKSVTVNGSQDQDRVASLRKKIGGDFIVFSHDGDDYVIRDAATVKAAHELYAPEEELGKQQEDLGDQQEVLGKKQEELGKQQEGVRVPVPRTLADHLAKIQEELRKLGPNANQDQLGDLQSELGDLQSEIGDLQGRAGDSQGELGRKQEELGEKQNELGRQQDALGREQEHVAREAARKMQDLIKQALANGKAQKAPE